MCSVASMVADDLSWHKPPLSMGPDGYRPPHRCSALRDACCCITCSGTEVVMPAGYTQSRSGAWSVAQPRLGQAVSKVILLPGQTGCCGPCQSRAERTLNAQWLVHPPVRRKAGVRFPVCAIEFGDILPKPTTVGTGLATTLGAGEFPLLIPDGMVLGVFQWAVNSHVVLIDSASDKRNPRF